jgi:3'-phosphoadenosine 5'-phosphosulfate sulfotransferase (PAPS reductase)/FAD synthetase
VKHIVGFSGGIDSQACARWVLNRYGPEDTILTNSDAGGWEDPITVEFVDWYSVNVHPVVKTNAIIADIWETPGYAETRGYCSTDPLTYQLMIAIKGRPPSRKAQFCTELLKLRPQRRWIRQAFGPGGQYEGQDYCRYAGVRRDESATREAAPFHDWDKWFDCPLHYPIADWTKLMCFEYIKAYEGHFNPLYMMGFNRVGCMPCINSGKEDMVNITIRRPEAIEKVRAVEQSTGRTFFAPMVPGMATNNIEEVIAWAKTGRGGRQAKFEMMFDRPACESKYGLCE